MDGLFSSETELSPDELYCQKCGQTDKMLGWVKDRTECENLLTENGYDLREVWLQSFLDKRYPKTNTEMN